MDRLILDTNIYIDYINIGQYKEYVLIKDYPQVILLSSIVLMELYAGAHAQKEINLIDTIRKPFEKRGMIIAPTSNDHILAGHILSTLQREEGYNLKKCYSLTNDLLIALSARRIGATVITTDKSDFKAIKKIKDFSLKIIGQ